jgi:hypothetical protein
VDSDWKERSRKFKAGVGKYQKFSSLLFGDKEI